MQTPKSILFDKRTKLTVDRRESQGTPISSRTVKLHKARVTALKVLAPVIYAAHKDQNIPRVLSNRSDTAGLLQAIRETRSLLKNNAVRHGYSYFTFSTVRHGRRMEVRLAARAGERPTRYDLATGRETLTSQIKQVRRSSKQKRTDDRYNWGSRIRRMVEDSPTVGGVREIPGRILLMANSRRSKRVFENKSPRTSEHHVGVEIEFYSKRNTMELGAALFDAGLAECVTLKYDGSLCEAPTGYPHAHEICIVAPEATIQATVTRVLSVIGPDGKVNKTCGLHVHLDQRSRKVEDSFHNLRSVQSLLYKMVPKTREANRYCKPTRAKTYEVASRSSDRYHGINTQAVRKFGTLEMRLHSGTLDPVKVNNWIALLTNLVNAPRLTKSVRSVSGLKKAAKLPDELTAYIASRVALFAGSEAAEAA